jgi:hypothetical protein
MTLYRIARRLHSHANALWRRAAIGYTPGEELQEITLETLADMLHEMHKYCDAAELDFSDVERIVEQHFPRGDKARAMAAAELDPPGNEWEHRPCRGCNDPGGCVDRCGAGVSPEGSFVNVGALLP